MRSGISVNLITFCIFASLKRNAKADSSSKLTFNNIKSYFTEVDKGKQDRIIDFTREK